MGLITRRMGSQACEGVWLAIRGPSGRSDTNSRFLLIAFNVAGEIVENGLPPCLLLLDGVRGFAVKGDADDDAFGFRGELDLRHAIAERIFDQLMPYYLRVGPGEIEAHAAVLGLHTRGESAALAQVNGGSGRMPVIRCGVPLLDVRGCRIGPPDLLDGRRDSGFDVDLHARDPLASDLELDESAVFIHRWH